MRTSHITLVTLSALFRSNKAFNFFHLRTRTQTFCHRSMATQKDVGPTTNSGDKAAAAAMRTGEGGAAAAVDLDGSFPGAEIDPGVQKYVLIEATDPSTSEKVHFVRGELVMCDVVVGLA